MARVPTPYEDLEGTDGKRIRYRPTRHRARDLVHDYPLEIRVDGEPGRLEDVAMNGVAFRIQSERERFEVGSEHSIELSMSGRLAYRGRGRVARTPKLENAETMLVATRLTEGFIDIRTLVDQHEQISFEENLRGGPERQVDGVPHAYRTAIGEMVHFLQFNRQVLDRRERRIIENGGDATALEAVVDQAVSALRLPYKLRRANAAQVAKEHFGGTSTFHRSNKTIAAMKRYTETMVTPLLSDVPILRRAYEKPLGYPGDYDQMMYIYRNRPEGDSVFAKVFHKLSIEEPLAAGVRTRKDLIKILHHREYGRVTSERGRAQPFKVTSVACGPAKEVAELIREQHDWPTKIQWTLMDQEEQALSLAYDSAYRALAEVPGEADIACLYTSFKRLVTEPELFREQGQRDFIYAAGLFDYLRPLLAQRLIIKLIESTKPGGLVAIGNARTDDNHGWSPEFVLDWSLIYRTEDEMFDLARNIPGVADAQVVPERSGGYWFLLLRKER